MTHSWRKVDELFAAALELEPKARQEFLHRECQDQELFDEVVKMLDFDKQASHFIETGVFEVATRLITDRNQSSSLRSTSSIDDARFVSGDLLSGRYRIVGLLGRGGMGEVYRADDLKLKQPVALKFLPESTNTAAIERFYKEVSVARQISHRNVCRVYDVAEYEGQHFISMEFVRGEELSSLLKRIGRLPQDKAIDVARQLCSGLAAVHERGVLHRDLKPANVMLDERGDVRLTDFGIAALSDEIKSDSMAGTPAYMSPEQLEGKELSTRSDIYSLGLVLYEVFTGKKAFEASTLPELLRSRRSDTTPTSPNEYVPELDPLIERVIFRCLNIDPSKRPASALQVAAALPGGDPLAAALAAGETPSPEMVAAAPKEGGLKPAVAISLLAIVFILAGLISYASRYTTLYSFVPLEKSPEVLRDRALELTRQLGYGDPVGDSSYGIWADHRYLDFVAETDNSRTRWARLSNGQPAALYFWYRQSPVPFDLSNGEAPTENSPAQTVPGMMSVTLDTRGRLRSFDAVPPPRTISSAATTYEWSILFKECGLDLSTFKPVMPEWTPPHASTERAAWEGSYPNQPNLKIRIEAASYEGRPIHFAIYEPWDSPTATSTSTNTFRERVLSVLLLTVFITAMVGSGLLALRNSRLGRGDRKGAFRLAAFLLGVFFLRWLLTAHHVFTENEALNFLANAKNMLFWSFFFWVVYLAFEPFVRKLWPHRIISWNRVLSGSFRDPLVGRDLLVGLAVGFGAVFCNFYLSYLVPLWLGQPPRLPYFDFPATKLLGIESVAFGMLQQVFGAVFQPFIVLFFFLLLYILLRRELVAAFALWVLMTVAMSLTHETAIGIPFASVTAFALMFLLYRYGLLSLVAAIYVVHLTIFFPVTSNFTAWYAIDYLVSLTVCLCLALFGFYTSLAGQKFLRGSLPD